MASATNAVQGLNQTIDLLQRILTAVESGNAGSRAASPRNLSTTLRTTAATGSLSAVKDVGNAVTSLSPLSKINKKTVAAADDMANVIKTVSSKEVIGGVMRLGAARPFMGWFESSMKLLVKAINSISSLHVTQRKIALFSKAMASIEKDVIKPLTKLLLSLPILITVCAGIGFLARGAFKHVMTGFKIIALIGTMTVALLVGLNIAVSFASKISGSNAFLGTRKSGVPPIVNAMLSIMLSFTGLVLISGMVGILSQRHIKTIMNGFWTIARIGAMVATVLIGFNLVFAIIRRIGLATAIGDITKNKTGITVPGVKEMALIMLSFAAMVLIAAGTGMIAQKNFVTIMLGLQIIGLIAIGMLAVAGVMGLIGKFFGDGTKNITHGLLMLSLSLLIITGVVYAITFVAKQIDAVGKEKVLDTISIVLKMLKRLTMLSMGLMLLSLITPDVSMKIAIAGLAMVTVAMMVMVGCLFAIIKVAEKIQKFKASNNDKSPFEIVSTIGPSIATLISTIGAGIGQAYASSPLLTLHIIGLGILINTISNFIDLVSKFEADGETITPIFYNNGVVTKGIPVNIVKVSENIAKAFAKFVTTLSTELDDISRRDIKKMTKNGKQLGKLIEPVSTFVKMLIDFNSDGENLTINRYDKNGNILRTDTVNLSHIATNISSSFGVFAKQMDETLNEIDIDYWAARQGERLGKLVDPLATFIDCISKINIVGTGEDLTIESTIDGKLVTTKPITTITHMKTIFSKFSEVFDSIDTDKSIFGSNFEDNVVAMAKMFENLSSVKFNDLDSIFSKNIPTDINSPWKLLNTFYHVPGSNQSIVEYYTVKINGFTGAFDNLCDSLFKNEQKFRETIKKYTEGVTELADKLTDVVDNLSKMNNTNVSINASGNIDNNVNTTQNTNQHVVDNAMNPTIDGSINKTNNAFDIDELSERIAMSLKNAINGNIRISFPDAKDDIIAMLQA